MNSMASAEKGRIPPMENRKNSSSGKASMTPREPAVPLPVLQERLRSDHETGR